MFFTGLSHQQKRRQSEPFEIIMAAPIKILSDKYIVNKPSFRLMHAPSIVIKIIN